MQAAILGGVVVPSQNGCEDTFVLDAAYAYATLSEEFSDVLSASETAELYLKIAESWYLQGIRNADPHSYSKSLAFAESAVDLRGEVRDVFALLSALLLRYQQQNTSDNLNKIAVVIQSQLSKQNESDALYHAALSTVQSERFRHSGDVVDLEGSVASSEMALKLHSLDFGIEAHLLLRTQLAQALFRLGRTTGNGTLLENAHQIAKETMKTSRVAGYDDLAAHIAFSIK